MRDFLPSFVKWVFFSEGLEHTVEHLSLGQLKEKLELIKHLLHLSEPKVNGYIGRPISTSYVF